jgi:hypothetical protein
MRALAAALLLAGCGSSSTGSDALQPPATGLVLAVHYDHTNVSNLTFSGATYASQRKFGPYNVAETSMPSDHTVGFVFDPTDAGRAMICGESRDDTGRVLETNCDTYAIRSDNVTHDDLTLYDVGP